MGPNLIAMSDDDLYRRIEMIHARLIWASNSSYGGNLVTQLQFMLEEVNGVLRDRMETATFEANVLSTPAVKDINGDPPKKSEEDKNSRAKSKSDIIARLKRSATPTNIKEI